MAPFFRSMHRRLLGGLSGLGLCLAGGLPPAQAITYWLNGSYTFGSPQTYSGFLTFAGSGVPTSGSSTSSAQVNFSAVPVSTGASFNQFTSFTYLVNGGSFFLTGTTANPTNAGADSVIFNLSSALTTSPSTGGVISQVRYGGSNEHFNLFPFTFVTDYCQPSGNPPSLPSDASLSIFDLSPRNNCTTTTFTGVTGAFRVPSPLSALMLLPLLPLVALRRRFQPLFRRGSELQRH